MKLNELHDNPGATKRRKRVARGPGSGKGKTAGRGIKGQKSRSGVAINAYEGGQMPLYMRLPKRGFTKPNRKEFAVINLGLLQKFVDAGKIDAHGRDHRGRCWSPRASCAASSHGVRLLAKGELTAALTLALTGASAAAVAAVEKAGGAITLVGARGGRRGDRISLVAPRGRGISELRFRAAGAPGNRVRRRCLGEGPSWRRLRNRWPPTSAGAPSARPRSCRAASSSRSAC